MEEPTRPEAGSVHGQREPGEHQQTTKRRTNARSYCIIRSDKLRRIGRSAPSSESSSSTSALASPSLPAQANDRGHDELCDGGHRGMLDLATRDHLQQRQIRWPQEALMGQDENSPSWRLLRANLKMASGRSKPQFEQEEDRANQQQRGQIASTTNTDRCPRAKRPLSEVVARNAQKRSASNKNTKRAPEPRVALKFAAAIQLSLVLIVLVLASLVTQPSSLVAGQQYRPEWPQKVVEQEIFLLNLEDGYFGCQVNASQDFLQLFELSRLCDGQTQCYLGSDELESQLKCRDRDRCESPPSPGSNSSLIGRNEEHVRCVNGVCLDGLCYCNDGYGGKSCDIPDENECKFRPCDVFAHCTNTMGSYYCSCFPGKWLYLTIAATTCGMVVYAALQLDCPFAAAASGVAPSKF